MPEEADELNEADLDEMTTPEAEDELESGYVPEDDTAPLQIPPIDRRLVTQPVDLSVKSIANQIDDGTLIVRPEYQRRYVWDNRRASRLVESLIMNIPIPGCFFAEEDDGKFTVIDGQQRLYSIWRFVRGQFKLNGLRTLPEYNGKLFFKLTEREQRLIAGRNIRCTIITQESHPEIRFEVFERINTGAIPLTDQEIRNAIFRGEFNLFLKELAEQPRWLAVLAKKQLDKRMRDDELVLRFFAVQDGYASYQAPLRSFLNSYASVKREHFPNDERGRLTVLFEETVDKVLSVFDDHAFRIYRGVWERQINRALFDAVMLVFSRLPGTELLAKRQEIDQALKLLCKDESFLLAVTRSTADKSSFYTRVNTFSAAMRNLGLESGIGAA